jgi:hypothetical protein
MLRGDPNGGKKIVKALTWFPGILAGVLLLVACNKSEIPKMDPKDPMKETGCDKDQAKLKAPGGQGNTAQVCGVKQEILPLGEQLQASDEFRGTVVVPSVPLPTTPGLRLRSRDLITHVLSSTTEWIPFTHVSCNNLPKTIGNMTCKISFGTMAAYSNVTKGSVKISAKVEASSPEDPLKVAPKVGVVGTAAADFQNSLKKTAVSTIDDWVAWKAKDASTAVTQVLYYEFDHTVKEVFLPVELCDEQDRCIPQKTIGPITLDVYKYNGIQHLELPFLEKKLGVILEHSGTNFANSDSASFNLAQSEHSTSVTVVRQETISFEQERSKSYTLSGGVKVTYQSPLKVVSGEVGLDGSHTDETTNKTNSAIGVEITVSAAERWVGMETIYGAPEILQDKQKTYTSDGVVFGKK